MPISAMQQSPPRSGGKRLFPCKATSRATLTHNLLTQMEEVKIEDQRQQILVK
ncbi:UNVERIFIED_CONTAM: hypothetical protein LBW93_04845 [Wolbachia endosymbiont of Nasonia longicornis]